MPRLKGSTIKKIKDNNNLNSRSILLSQKLLKYYKNNDKSMNVVTKVIGSSKKDIINLNIIKFFLDKYCKKHVVIIKGKNIYSQYKSLTKNYSKQQFSFSKKTTHKLKMVDGKEYYLTMMNIFKWVIENDIIEFIEKNHDKIYKEYNIV